MADTYQWRAHTKYNSTTTLSYGVTPSDQSNWQTDAIGNTQSSRTWTWWYRDSNKKSGSTYTDAISSRVAISVTESWTTSKDDKNNLYVRARVVINSIIRDDLKGSDNNLPGRQIEVYKEQGGLKVLNLTDTQIATAHTIYSGPLSMAEYSFKIAPGQNKEHSTLYLHNKVVSSSITSYDDIWIGVQFRNILPDDYRPGKVYDNNAKFQSHNRTNGKAHIYDSILSLPAGSTSHNVEWKLSNGTYTPNGTTTTSSWSDITGKNDKVLESGVYTFSIGTPVDYGVDLCLYNDQTDSHTSYPVAVGKTSIAIELSSECQHWQLRATGIYGKQMSKPITPKLMKAGNIKEMRTVNGGSGTGNPPTIRHSDKFKNMRRIGENA